MKTNLQKAERRTLWATPFCTFWMLIVFLVITFLLAGRQAHAASECTVNLKCEDGYERPFPCYFSMRMDDSITCTDGDCFTDDRVPVARDQVGPMCGSFRRTAAAATSFINYAVEMQGFYPGEWRFSSWYAACNIRRLCIQQGLCTQNTPPNEPERCHFDTPNDDTANDWMEYQGGFIREIYEQAWPSDWKYCSSNKCKEYEDAIHYNFGPAIPIEFSTVTNRDEFERAVCKILMPLYYSDSTHPSIPLYIEIPYTYKTKSNGDTYELIHDYDKYGKERNINLPVEGSTDVIMHNCHLGDKWIPNVSTGTGHYMVVIGFAFIDTGLRRQLLLEVKNSWRNETHYDKSKEYIFADTPDGIDGTKYDDFHTYTCNMWAGSKNFNRLEYISHPSEWLINTRTNDPDKDGVPAVVDNCPDTSNPADRVEGLRVQKDSDYDGIGDACDFGIRFCGSDGPGYVEGDIKSGADIDLCIDANYSLQSFDNQTQKATMASKWAILPMWCDCKGKENEGDCSIVDCPDLNAGFHSGAEVRDNNFHAKYHIMSFDPPRGAKAKYLYSNGYYATSLNGAPSSQIHPSRNTTVSLDLFPPIPPALGTTSTRDPATRTSLRPRALRSSSSSRTWK